MNRSEKEPTLCKDCDISIIGIVLLKGLNDLMATVAGAGLPDQEYPVSLDFTSWTAASTDQPLSRNYACLQHPFSELNTKIIFL